MSEREGPRSKRGCCVIVKNDFFFPNLTPLYRHLGSPHLHQALHSVSRSRLYASAYRHRYRHC